MRDKPTRDQFRKALVRVARAEIGKRESPAGSNRVKYGVWYGLNGTPWCAMFVSWVYAQAAQQVGCENPLAGLQSPKGFARCTSTYNAAKRMRIIVDPHEPLMPGDVLIWAKSRSRLLSELTRADGHTGIVTFVHGDGMFDVVEGNTDGTFSRTGGIVQEHTHRVDDGRHGHLLAVYRPTRRIWEP